MRKYKLYTFYLIGATLMVFSLLQTKINLVDQTTMNTMTEVYNDNEIVSFSDENLEKLIRKK